MAGITRRSALQTTGVAGLAGVIAGVESARADESASPKFKTQLSKPKIVKPKIADLGDLPAVDISPDGLAMTISFDSLQLDLSQGDDLTATLVASLLIPVSVQEPATERFRGYAAHARGFVSKEPGTRVVVTLDLGEVHDAAEFPYDQELSEDFQRNVFSFPSGKKSHETPSGGVLTSPAASAPHFPATITLSIQRRSTRDQALVVVDSLNLEIIDPEKGPGNEERKPAEKKNRRLYGRAAKGR